MTFKFQENVFRSYNILVNFLKWMYAVSLTPVWRLTKEEFRKEPPGTTDIPYTGPELSKFAAALGYRPVRNCHVPLLYSFQCLICSLRRDKKKRRKKQSSIFLIVNLQNVSIRKFQRERTMKLFRKFHVCETSHQMYFV